MNKEDDFSQSTVAIVGLGLMGGSLAFALAGKCKRMIGIDLNKETVELALARGAVDVANTDPEAIIDHADIIILALPVRSILKFIRRIPDYHPGDAIVMDLGSTKVEILDAMLELPKVFDPIGGHPMCGKETSGFESADPGIYQGAPFALTPLERTSSKARRIALTLTQAIGATPIWLDPETHDEWAAYTSHLPYLSAVSLVRSMLSEAAPLIGPGFRGASRLAASDREMMIDILTTNSEHVLESIRHFRENLEELEKAIREGDTGSLKAILEDASHQRNLLIRKQGSDEARN